jgi:SAM-dependent methyltransferase
VNWKYKACIHKLLSSLDRGVDINHLLQLYVTKTLPPSRSTVLEEFLFAKEHIEKIRHYGDVWSPEPVFYEIGAGWDLTNALSFYCFGVDRQIVTDLRRLMKPELVIRSADLTRLFAREHGCVREPPLFTTQEPHRAADELFSVCGISYLAPFDASRTAFADSSIDCITCTKVFQHVPVDDLRSLLAECRRVLKPGGIMSALIDYRDNFSYGDPAISVYNFLRFSDQEWARWNPRLSYQNRLRHSDFFKLFDAGGFTILEASSSSDGPEAVGALEKLPLAEKFRSYALADLAAARGWYVVRRR